MIFIIISILMFVISTLFIINLFELRKNNIITMKYLETDLDEILHLYKYNTKDI